MKVTGSIQPKHGYYQMVVRIPKDEQHHRQKSKSTGVPVEGRTHRESDANKKKAEKMLTKWIIELEEKNTVDSDRMLVDCIDEWLERHKASIRINTWELYDSYVRNHIRPYFEPKGMKISDVTGRDIQRYIDAKYKEGQSPQSIKKHLVILNGVFQESVNFCERETNPCNGVSLPKVKKFKGDFYTVDQVQKLLSCLDDDPVKPAVMLGLYLGLRRSEVAGLRWQDIDFDNNIVHIRNTIVRFSSLIEEEHTKSDSSERDLFLPNGLKTYLLELQERQNQNSIVCGAEYKSSGHVCQWPDGAPYRPDYITHRFHAFLEKNDLPMIRFHDLRHTAGSLLFNSGCVSGKQIQEFLGHSQISTTMDIYVHSSFEGKQETANNLDAILSPVDVQKKSC